MVTAGKCPAPQEAGELIPLYRTSIRAYPFATPSAAADAAPLQVDDWVSIAPVEPPPPGQPPAPLAYGTIEAVDALAGRATVRVENRRRPLELPVVRLQRVRDARPRT
jgi:hypothetical protein